MQPHPDRLLRVPLFAALTDAQRARIASWLDTDEVKAGARLARSDSVGYDFFIIDEGRVRVEHDGTTIGVLGPGEVFGEMSLFSPSGRRNADVVAETDVRVFTMFGTHFREMQVAMPEVTERLKELTQERDRQLHASEDEA